MFFCHEIFGVKFEYAFFFFLSVWIFFFCSRVRIKGTARFLLVDLGSNNSGYYDLQAVLTHQGRSSSSGHYVGWVKRKEGNRICVTVIGTHLTSVSPNLYCASASCVVSSGVVLTDEWVKFDDDKVSVVSPEDILRLSGGGDWHIAYVLLYGPRRLDILGEEQ